MEAPQFKRIRERLWRELVAARSHFEIWKQLWTDREAKVRVENTYRVFAHHTREAHAKLLYLQVSKVTDRNKRSVSIWRLIDAATSYPALTRPGHRDNLSTQRPRLEAHNALLQRVRWHRDKRVAHFDEKPGDEPDRPTIGEISQLLNDLETTLNDVSAAHDGEPAEER